MRLIARLYPRPPYRFDLLLDVLRRYAHPTVDIALEDAYWRVLPVDGRLALLRVLSAGDPDRPALDVALAAGDAEPAAALAALDAVLPLDHDPQPFYALAQADPRLWPVIAPLVGLPLLRAPTLFEALAQSIIEQQISWIAAQRAQRWLVEWGGQRLVYGGRAFYAFPTPEQIASASVEALAPLKITFKRIALLIEVARQVAAGHLRLEALRAAPAEEAYRALVSIKGVGHWTATVALERACGPRELVAFNDVVLQLAVQRFYYGGQGNRSEQAVRAVFAGCGPLAGVAAYYTLIRYMLESFPPRS